LPERLSHERILQDDLEVEVRILDGEWTCIERAHE
jgi:hypothetical protein